jgi:hypothetical protein
MLSSSRCNITVFGALFSRMLIVGLFSAGSVLLLYVLPARYVWRQSNDEGWVLMADLVWADGLTTVLGWGLVCALLCNECECTGCMGLPVLYLQLSGWI